MKKLKHIDLSKDLKPFVDRSIFSGYKLFDTPTCERIAAYFLGCGQWAIKILRDRFAEPTLPIMGGDFNNLDQFILIDGAQNMSCSDLFGAVVSG